MTTTQESGTHVTPERIRADGEAMERAGFRLVYERPLAELEEDYPRWSRCVFGPWSIFSAGYAAPRSNVYNWQ